MAGLTTTLALTTTFTPAANCNNGPWIYKGVSTTWWKVGGDNVTSCFPPAYPFSRSQILYSPGLCPAGWTSACSRSALVSGRGAQDVVSCCPSSFKCATSSFDGWDTNYGCVAPYTVDKAGWGMSSGDAFVSSIYQLQVMIVEATPTPSSSLSSSTISASPSIASTLVTTSSSTGSPAASPAGTQSNSSDLSGGAIAGIVIGSVVGVAVIGILGYIAWMVRKRHRAEAAPQPPPMEYHGGYQDPGYQSWDQHASEPPSELDAMAQRHELGLKAPATGQMHELKS